MAAKDCACVATLEALNWFAPSETWKASCWSSYEFLYRSFHSGQVLSALASRSHSRILLGFSCEAKTDLAEVARRVALEGGRSMLFEFCWAS